MATSGDVAGDEQQKTRAGARASLACPPKPEGRRGKHASCDLQEANHGGKRNIPAITTQGLAKTYLLYPSPRHRLLQFLWRGKKQFYRPVEALKPLDITLKKGETVGIVGRNGSGKSTLLQMLCGTLAPSAGNLQINGRIAALLELGAGFNPAFTGRENVYLNGAILGFSRKEIDARFGAIAEFANIGEFIDQPVSTYSSGMTVRLAFAIAVSADPDILVVDEALAVGDESFQRKCFARIQEMQRRGVAILFVSHAAQAVIDICDRALLLDQGELLLDGDPRDVITRYHKLAYAAPAQRQSVREEIKGGRITATRRSSVEAATGESGKNTEGFDAALLSESAVEYPAEGGRITAPRLTTAQAEQVNLLVQGKQYQFRYRLSLEQEVDELRCGMLIKTKRGTEVAGTVYKAEKRQAGDTELVFTFECLLNPGLYFMNCGVVGIQNGEERYLHRLVDALVFRVIREGGNDATDKLEAAGLVNLQFNCTEEAQHA